MVKNAAIETQFRNCPFCEAGCGLAVTVDRTRDAILSVRGDPDDPASHGYICVKSQALAGLRDDPDRLRRPLRRRGRDFEEIGWDVAMAEACDRLRFIRERDGADSIGYYLGNPTAHRAGLALYLPAVFAALATRQIYWVGPIDQAPKMLSSSLMFGSPWMVSLPDIDRTDYLLIIGANPVISNGSVLIAPGLPRRIEAVRARGGTVVVIDPRRTETAAIADEHVPVVPGSDALLLMAMVHTLFAEHRVAIGRLAGAVRGLDALREIASGFSPEQVAAATAVPADTIRRLARALSAAPRAAIYGRTGTCTQAFGSICNWLIDALHLLTGNLDRAGGAMFSPGVPFSPGLAGDGVPPVGRWQSRVRGLPEFMGMMPAAALADEILGAGPGRVRGFITQAGNPVLSHPNGRRVAEAFGSLEFMLSIDIYLNETTRFADIILPGRDYTEVSDFPAVTSYSMISQYVKWAPPLFAASGEIPDDGRILTELAAGLRGVSPAQVEDELVGQMLHAARAGGHDACRGMDDAAMRVAIGDVAGADRFYDIMLRAGRYGDAFGAVPGGLSLAMLRERPHGIDYGPLVEELPAMLSTADGMIDLAPALLVSDVARLREEIGKSADPGSVLLVGRRDARSKNSWLHNVAVLAKGKPRCTLAINPADAGLAGLADGGPVTIIGDAGTLVATAQVDDTMMPGVVSLPHGWGHGGDAGGQSVAAFQPGVNANALIDERAIDVPSAASVLNGTRVRVRAA